MKKLSLKISSLVLVATMAALPMISMADGHDRDRHRDNTWKDLSIAGAAVGVYGLIKGDSSLALAGLIGGGYSAYRADDDHRYDRDDYRWRDRDDRGSDRWQSRDADRRREDRNRDDRGHDRSGNSDHNRRGH